jgi:hypothetical protein
MEYGMVNGNKKKMCDELSIIKVQCKGLRKENKGA